MSPRLSRALACLLLIALLMPILAACQPAGGQPATQTQPTSPSSKPAGQSTSAPTAAPAKPSTGGDPSKRVSDALGLLMGTSGEPGALPAFHIEIKMASPSYDRQAKAVKTNNTDMKADVQGVDAHVWILEDDGKTTEGYVIGDDDYVVNNGKVEKGGLLGVGFSWALWQLEPVIVLSLAGLGAKQAGNEAIDGRTADVFDVDMAKADKAVLAGVQAFIGKGIAVARGKVWVDQQTGALLKTVLDYELDLYDATSSDKNAPPVGHGSGHIEITATKVGKVTVSLPK